MSKRLQVVVKDEELESFTRAASTLGLTLSEWVRQELRRAERDICCDDVERKLAVLEQMVNYPDPPPSPDIDQMNEEIERGYLSDDSWS